LSNLFSLIRLIGSQQDEKSFLKVAHSLGQAGGEIEKTLKHF
jgi:hypothetical protein